MTVTNDDQSSSSSSLGPSFVKHHRRRSSLLSDFATLIRSHNTFHKNIPSFQPPAESLLFSGYDDMNQERPSRGLFKGENRLYNFLTRSRSRSRSNNSSTMPDRNSGSKPVSRIQSRPLSSTTTATNTTVTPATPKAIKRSQLPPPPAPVSRPTTPKSSATRQKINNFFDLALGRKSSSRSRSRSRPSSPQPSLDVPPLPSPGHDNDATPRPRRSFSSHHSRSPSPTQRVLRLVNPSDMTPSTTSIKLPRFFSSRDTDNTSLSRPPSSGSPPILPPIPSIVSGPIRRVPSVQRRSKPPNDPDMEPPNQQSEESVAPKITQTPPTPLKAASSGSSSEGNHSVPGSRAGFHAVKGSLDSGFRYRGATMDVVDEEGRNQTPTSSNLKGKSKDSGVAIPRTGLKMSNATRATKHGSFDFERPGWSAINMQRTGSNGTTGTGTSASGLSRTGEYKERDSTYGPGLAGVGTLQRDLSVKRAHEREEAVRARERAKRHALEVAADKEWSMGKPLPAVSASQRTTPSDQMHASTSTAGTGKSSSMGRSAGKKALAGPKPVSGIAGSRLTAQHGLFSFEPPVPSPTRSTGSTGTAHEVTLSWGKTEKEKERLTLEKERQRDRKGLQQRGDRPPVPVPKLGTNAGHRSGTKGRSLDLGLGLAWAPSKVREEALLPSSTFFTRTMSNSSAGGRSTSGSTVGHSGSSSNHHTTNGKSKLEADVERSKLGKEVAEVFKKALDANGYAMFKTYVHQFDAHEIPFDGPTGIVTLVDDLLATSQGLQDSTRRKILDKFVRIILQQA